MIFSNNSARIKIGSLNVLLFAIFYQIFMHYTFAVITGVFES